MFPGEVTEVGQEGGARLREPLQHEESSPGTSWQSNG